MSSDSALGQLNPFSARGTVGRAILTGGLSLYPEAAMKLTAPKEPPPPMGTPAPPSRNDQAVGEAYVEARQSRGRAATIFAGNSKQGASGTLAKQVLLGA